SKMSSFHAVNPATNQTVWIPFFIRFSRLPEDIRPYYESFVICEVIGHVFSLAACFFAMYVFFKVRALHFNLSQAIMNGYYTGPAFIILRFPLILMETGVIKYDSMADDIIVVISIIRMWMFVSLYNFEVNITVERYFALKHVRTYEKVQRRYISAIILSANAVYSMILAYLLTYNYLHGFFYVAFVCVANNIALIMFFVFAKKNDAIRAKLIQFRKNDGSYSVSYRWQLQDNARSAKELRVLMIGCNGVISVILPILFVPALIFDNDPLKSEILEAAKLFYQVSSAYVFGGSYLYVLFVLRKHRDYVFGTSAV
ncbi:hypothetical protein PMAYCL1PPCAC_21554, partial [Pristionchus mayeri]